VPEAALLDLKVLDLTHFIAGPYCTRFLAGLGAEVVKIEKPDGDGARRIGPFPNDVPDLEKSGLFLYLNQNKLGITLNLKTETGVKIFKELVKDADILVENFSPRVMPSLGLDYERLEKINPRLVMVSISNFGQTGPYRDYKAADIIEYALGGLMYITGQPEREPLKNGGNLAQYGAGLHAFVATLSALYCAQTMGIGQQVDISIMECVASIIETQDMAWIYQGDLRKRAGQGTRFGWGPTPAKDGFVSVALNPPRRVAQALPKLVGDPALEDPKFFGRARTPEVAEELERIVRPWFAEHEKEEIYHAAQKLGMPVGYLANAADLFKSPQLKAREYFAEVDHPRAGKLAYPTSGVKMSETPWQVGRAPVLGEHNEEIYCGRLGYTKEDLVRLRERGIV